MQLDLFDAQSNDILSQKDYAAFKKSLYDSGCQKCALHEGRTQIVVDRGSPTAKIMVIGEAPGEKEDLQGAAFVGRAGKLFDEIMKAIGLDSDKDMLIANVVKCRPPGNRAPHDEEAQACFPYLRRQIELAAPRVILLLGATALKRMDPSKKNFSMDEEAGKFFELPDYPGILFLALYHPAALLYNSKLKPAMWEHAKSLRALIRNNFVPAAEKIPA
jgi:uracil-DNA glycosylase